MPSPAPAILRETETAPRGTLGSCFRSRRIVEVIVLSHSELVGTLVAVLVAVLLGQLSVVRLSLTWSMQIPAQWNGTRTMDPTSAAL